MNRCWAFLLILVPLLSLLASCQPLPSRPPPGVTGPPVLATQAPTATPAADSFTFNGDRAYQWVLKQVFAQDGSLQPRIPGSPGAQAVVSIVTESLKASGWQVRQQTFTGRDYFALDLAPVRDYITHCDAKARERVLGLTFTNIIASYGSGPTVILGAHYDTKRTASQDPDPSRRREPVLGANDGASGVAVLLELGRLLPSLVKDRRVALAFLDGEDGFEDCHPLAGSLYYAQRLSAQEKQATRVFILLDMVGDRDAVFAQELHSQQSAPRWVELLWGVAQEQGAKHFVNSPGGGVIDDHLSFIHQGIPSVDIIDYRPGSGFPPTWHTAADLPDAISPLTLAEVGAVLLEVLRKPLP